MLDLELPSGRHQTVLAGTGRPLAHDSAHDGIAGVDPVRYAVALHVLMSQAEIELWQSWADRLGLEVDDAMHVACLCGLKYQLTWAGDEVGTHVAEACEREMMGMLLVRLCFAFALHLFPDPFALPS